MNSSDQAINEAEQAAHPEEMKGTISFRIGNWLGAKFVARATPAGLIAAALLVTAVFVPIVMLAKRR